jgi:hypothetical protein
MEVEMATKKTKKATGPKKLKKTPLKTVKPLTKFIGHENPIGS